MADSERQERVVAMTLSELLEEIRKAEREVRVYCIDNGIAIPRHYIKKWRLIDTPTGPRLAAYIAEVKR